MYSCERGVILNLNKKCNILILALSRSLGINVLKE